MSDSFQYLSQHSCGLDFGVPGIKIQDRAGSGGSLEYLMDVAAKAKSLLLQIHGLLELEGPLKRWHRTLHFAEEKTGTPEGLPKEHTWPSRAGLPELMAGSVWVNVSSVNFSRLLVETRPRTGSEVGRENFQKRDFEN